MENCHCEPTKESIIKKFLPLISLASVVVLFTLFRQYRLGNFNAGLAMMDIMAGYFLIFGSLKVINIRNFAQSYAKYDSIAQKTLVWAYIYPFVEVTFGIAYFIKIHNPILNVVVALLMIQKAHSVHKVLSAKETLQCACLGGFFTIPITRVTLFEDLVMAIMAILMIWV